MPSLHSRFFTTPPDASTQIILPEKLPFLKSGRKNILQEKLFELTSDGELSEQDSQMLQKAAFYLGLDKSDLDDMQKQAFVQEFNVIQRKIEQSCLISDEDLVNIEALKKKYGIANFTMSGEANLCRQLYLLEVKGVLPNPISSHLMLDKNETCYYFIHSTWLQTRVRNLGYTGASLSIPTGISGVRLRFGHYSPARSEEITPLTTGTLWLTSKRLIFHGDSRSTKIELKKILDAHIYSDSLKIEKATGKPDYFSMKAVEGRFITSLIGNFRGQA